MSSARELLFASRVVAIVRLDQLERSLDLVRVLLDAGIRCIELTLTNPNAPRWIEELLHDEPRFRSGEACLGLGSIRSVAEAELAWRSGAQFVVTPIASVAVVERCKSAGIPVAAGACTPTEIAGMWDAGADLVKVFPARSFGPPYIKDVLGPMPYLKLMPTGGIDASNARDYLNAGATAVGVGGSICRADWVNGGQWDALHRAASELVQAVAV